jgi:Tol biopolymer transport system component/DNA-binding winged helix-turn-helix (wHTH) protein
VKRTPPQPGDHLFCFGPFVADPVTERLYHDAADVDLPHRAFEVLLALARRSGATARREQLFAEIWPGVFVEENNLARHISVIRKALRLRDPDRDYIVTVPGAGYRFGEPVVEVERSTLATRFDQDPVGIDDRGDGRDVSSAIVSPAAALSPPAPPGRTVARARVGWVAAALVLGAVGVGTGLWLSRTPSTLPNAGVARRLWEFAGIGDLSLDPSWSPDGRRIAFSSNRNRNFDIWIQPLDGGGPVQLTDDPSSDWQPAWSPDGRTLAFRSERDGGGLFAVSLSDGTTRRLTGSGYEPQWSPDGGRIVYYLTAAGPRRPVMLTDVADGSVMRLRSDVFDEFRVYWAGWDPGGAALSVYGNHVREGWSFWTVPLESGPPVRAAVASQVERQLRSLNVDLARFTWSPAGDALFWEGRADGTENLWKITVDPATRRWVDGPERLTTGSDRQRHPSASPDGRRVAFGSGLARTRVWSLPVDPGTGQLSDAGEPMTSDGSDTFVVDVSADGRELAYRLARRGRDELRVRGLQTGIDRLASVETDAQILQPRWSRDGAKLAYLRAEEAGGALETSLVLLSGPAGDKRTLSAASYPTNVYDWAPDDAGMLVGCRPRPGPISICQISFLPNGRGYRVLASDRDRSLYAARTSPSGRWISFIAWASGSPATSAVYVMSASGGPWRTFTDGQSTDDKPRWSPDGRILYYLSTRSGFWNVWARRVDAATGAPVGSAFRVTAFDTPATIIDGSKNQTQMSVIRDRLMVPITERSGGIWILEEIHP